MKTIEQQVEEYETRFIVKQKDIDEVFRNNPNCTPKLEEYVRKLMNECVEKDRRVSKWLTQALQERDRIAREEERERAKKIINELQYQNCLKKNGAVITNTHNGGYSLDSHQQRMDDEFDRAKKTLTTH
jgi:ribonuclease D